VNSIVPKIELPKDFYEQIYEDADRAADYFIERLEESNEISIEDAASGVAAFWAAKTGAKWAIGKILVYLRNSGKMLFGRSPEPDKDFSRYLNKLANVSGIGREEIPPSTLWCYYTTAKFSPNGPRYTPSEMSFTAHYDAALLAKNIVDAREPGLSQEERDQKTLWEMDRLSEEFVENEMTVSDLRNMQKEFRLEFDLLPSPRPLVNVIDKETGEAVTLTFMDDEEGWNYIMRRIGLDSMGPSREKIGLLRARNGNNQYVIYRNDVPICSLQNNVMGSNVLVWLEGKTRFNLTENLT